MKDKNKRRRIFYIDKIFQKKLLVLFLGLNGIIVAANIVFYMTHLKDKLESSMFRSHIDISNLNEILADEVIHFNILLAVGTLLLVLIFYTVIRLRLISFFMRIKQAIHSRQTRVKQDSGPQEEQRPQEFEIREEFQEIDRVLGSFIKTTDREMAAEAQRIGLLKETLKRESGS